MTCNVAQASRQNDRHMLNQLQPLHLPAFLFGLSVGGCNRLASIAGLAVCHGTAERCARWLRHA